MTLFENLKMADMKDLLLQRGFIVKKTNKAFLTLLFNHIESGNLLINPDFVDHLSTQIEEQNNQIRKLEEELHEKTIHLNRTLDSSESYKVAAIESEEMLNGKIDEQSKNIDNLKCQIAKLSQLDRTCDSCNEYMVSISKLSREVEIKTLETHSQISVIEALKKKLADLNSRLNELNSTHERNLLDTQMLNSSSAIVKKNRILLASDSQGRYCGPILYNLFDQSKYQTLCLTKPNANFEIVAEDAYRLSLDYTKEDFVILLAGSNNASRNSLISKEMLESTTKKLSHTNIILVLTPFWGGHIHYNSIVLQNNITFSTTLQDAALILDSSLLLSSTHFTRNGLHMNRNGKIKLLTATKNIILLQNISTNSPFRI